MKRLSLLFLVFGILIMFPTVLLSAAFAFPESSFIGDLRVNYLDGDVQVKPTDEADWVPASINMPLMEGDAIWVPEGARMSIQLRNSSFVRLNENSSLEILGVRADSYQFHLSTGHAYINSTGRQKALLQMDTPVSSVRAYERSRFRVDVYGDGYTDVSVFSGIVYAEGRNGKTTVTAGNIFSLREDDYAELSPLGPSDDWERWNREMDSIRERRYSSRYLPSELSVYSDDLDGYGKWVYISDYGYCWTPTAISVGWSPYRFGRWTWIGGDYVWVSYERWGWAPYHYGRWAFVASTGWCWVPPAAGQVYWGPGYVGWVHTPDYVAWVPLAPGETYYGYGNYGPRSVNLVNVNINTIRITNVYKNVYVNNGVTVVGHDTFVTGRPSRVDLRENLFLAHRMAVGRPQIRPAKTSYMPVVRSIPQTKVPPPAIRQIRVRELKESRPLVKSRSQSVLRPGTTLRTMPLTTLKEPRRPGTMLQPGALQPRVTGKEVEERGVTRREIQRPSGVVKEEKKPAVTRREIQKPGGVIKEEKKPEARRKEIQGPGGVVTEEKKPETVVRTIPRPSGAVREGKRPEVTRKEIQKAGGSIREEKKPEARRKEIQGPGSVIKEEKKPGVTTKEIRKPSAVTREAGKGEQKGTEKELNKEQGTAR